VCGVGGARLCLSVTGWRGFVLHQPDSAAAAADAATVAPCRSPPTPHARRCSCSAPPSTCSARSWTRQRCVATPPPRSPRLAARRPGPCRGVPGAGGGGVSGRQSRSSGRQNVSLLGFDASEGRHADLPASNLTCTRRSSSGACQTSSSCAAGQGVGNGVGNCQYPGGGGAARAPQEYPPRNPNPLARQTRSPLPTHPPRQGCCTSGPASTWSWRRAWRCSTRASRWARACRPPAVPLRRVPWGRCPSPSPSREPAPKDHPRNP
jgi:hypothetical protein